MDGNEKERIFAQAMEDFRAGRLRLARHGLRQLVDDGSRDPCHLSYCGLLSAMTDKDDEGSIALCERAVEQDGRRQSELYLNLARALVAKGRRREAITALERGVVIHEDDKRLREELRHLVPRAKPRFPSLGRQHPLNKCYGVLRTLSGKFWSTLTLRRRDA